MLWCDKYCPKKISELSCNKYKVNECLKYLKKKDRKPFLVLSGPCSVGKSTIAKLILEHQKYDIIEFNFGNIESRKDVINTISNIINRNSINSLIMKEKKYTGIIIDDASNFSSDYFKKILSLIKKRKIVKNPIVLTCRNVNKISSIKSYYEKIVLSKPKISELLDFSNNIIENEKLSIDDDALLSIIKLSQNDFRRLTYILYYFYVKYGENTICLKDIEKCNHILSCKNIDFTIYEITDKVLNNYNNIKNSLRLCNCDKTLLGLMVHENYLTTIKDNRKGEISKKIDTITKISDLISLGNIFEKNVIVDKLWELDIDTIFFRAAYPSFLLNQMDKYSYNKNNSIKFTRMLSNNTQTYGLYKKIEENKFLKESSNNIIYLKIDLLLHLLFNDKESFFRTIRKYDIKIDGLEKYVSNTEFKSKFTKSVKKKLIKEYKKFCENN